MKLTWDDLKAGSLYQLTVDHRDWDGVIFTYISKEPSTYNIEVLLCCDPSSRSQNGFHGVEDKSLIGLKSTIKYIGTKEENPEYFL